MSGPRESPSVSLVTTCKGRLHHLRQSLPHFLNQDYPGPWDVFVVDYGCPDGTAEFVAAASSTSPRLKCLHVRDATDEFVLPRARNIGGVHASGELLAFVDADHCPSRDFLTRCVARMRESGLSRVNLGDAQGVFGDHLIRRSLFQRLRGYDESFDGWGWDDIDLYNRAEAAGEPTALVPRSLVTLIHHENDDRVRFCSNKDTASSSAANWNRSQARIGIVNPAGFGATSDFETFGMERPDPWALLRDRYPWPAHRPLLPVREPSPPGSEMADWCRNILDSVRPRTVFVLGSRPGPSTRFLLNEAPAARVVAIERWQAGPGSIPGDLTAILPYPFEQFLANHWDERDRLSYCRNDPWNGLRELAGLGVVPDLILLDADRPAEGLCSLIGTIAALFPQAGIAGDGELCDDSPAVLAALEASPAAGRTLVIDGRRWRVGPNAGQPT